MTIKFNLGGNATPATSSTGADAKPAAPAAPSRFVLPAGILRTRPVVPLSKPITLNGTGFTKKVAALTQTDDKRANVAPAPQATLALTPVASVVSDIVHAATLDLSHLILPTTLTGDITLDPSQQAAVDGLVAQRYGCIIGAAGTGKTTTVKAIVSRLLATVSDLTITFVAFTGRAVQQIKRALPSEMQEYCDTIHGLLEYAPEPEERDDGKGGYKIVRVFKPRRTEFNPLTQNVIIVDEGGMVPPYLWNNIFKALARGARVYLLGDINQLPPVQGRSVLGFAMLSWPTFELARIHRTGEDDIVTGAWDILHGKMPKASGCAALLRVSTNSIEANQHLRAAVQKLHKSGQFDPMQDAIIVPQNVGTIGQEELNRALTPYFNPPQRVNGVIVNPRTIVTAGSTHRAFATGDKIMVTQNDREQGLTNGMIGIIVSITVNANYKGETIGALTAADLQDSGDFSLDGMHEMNVNGESEEEIGERDRQASHIVTIRFQNVDDDIEFSTAGAINTLKHAYAFTCHKAQGGEYRNVVILVHSANSTMLCREWLYTAWTRAKERVILVYNPRGIEQSLNNQRITGNNLAEKAAKFNELQARNADDPSGVKIPYLPAPEAIAA